jgi:hypothetical protein
MPLSPDRADHDAPQAVAGGQPAPVPSLPVAGLPAAGPAAPAAAAPPRQAAWVTLLVTVLGVGGYLMLQTGAGLVLLLPAALREAAAGSLDPEALGRLLQGRLGLVAWAGIAVAVPVSVAAFWWLARWQGPGGARRRLALVWPRRRDALGWLLAVIAFGWLWEHLAVWLERPAMPPVMEQVFRTAGWLPALLVAVAVLAPAFEEVAFRGFCLGGLARRGPLVAIGLSSVLFAAIHLQYDLFDMGGVLALGALFGAARWQSGSTLLAIGLHAFHNSVASVQALWLIGEPLW